MLCWAWKCRYLFNILFSFPLDKYSEVELLDRTVVAFLIFWRIAILFAILFPHSGCTNLFSHQKCTRFPFSPHPWHIYYLMSILISHADRCVRWYLRVFTCNSLRISDGEQLFICLLTICKSSLEKCLFISSVHFLNSFYVGLYEFFIYLGY